jgi:hypothetical protein
MPDEQQNDLTEAEQAAMGVDPEFYDDEDQDDAEDEDDVELEAAEADDTAPVEAAEPAEAADEPAAAIPNWQAPEDADRQIEALNSEAEALAQQFDAGQLSAADFHTLSRHVDDQRANLTRQVDRAQIGEEMRRADWVNGAVKRFLDQHPRYRANKSLFTALDAEVKHLQIESGNNFDPNHLRRAHANLEAASGRSSRRPAKRDAAVHDDGGERDVGADPGGRFARLDRLAKTNPSAFEERMLAMSDDERDAYLMAG